MRIRYGEHAGIYPCFCRRSKGRLGFQSTFATGSLGIALSGLTAATSFIIRFIPCKSSNVAVKAPKPPSSGNAFNSISMRACSRTASCDSPGTWTSSGMSYKDAHISMSSSTSESETGDIHTCKHEAVFTVTMC